MSSSRSSWSVSGSPSSSRAASSSESTSPRSSRSAAAPALADHRVHLPVDHRHHGGEHALGLEMAGVAQLHQQIQRVHRRGQHAPQRLAQPALDGAALGAAPTPNTPRHDHLQGHRLHPRRQRERLADRPAVDLLVGDVGDHLDVALHGLAVERRQQQLALAHVARADRGEHRVGPEDRPQRRLPGERRRIGGIGLEQRAQMVGVAGDDERLAARGHPNMPHVAVAPLGAEREGHRPTGEAQPLKRGGRGGPGRHVDRGARLDRSGRRGRCSLLLGGLGGRAQLGGRGHGTEVYRTSGDARATRVPRSGPAAPMGGPRRR